MRVKAVVNAWAVYKLVHMYSARKKKNVNTTKKMLRKKGRR